MIVVGLTGSIGMGKTTAAQYIKRLGIPVHEADAEVHKLMQPGGAAVEAVTQAFPGVVSNGIIDRQKLGAAVFGKPDELARLEAILHPLVREDSIRWCEAQRARGVPLVVLDIPLLYEIGREKDCDVVWVVTAPAWIQRRRVLARFGITQERLDAVLARQMPDAEKRRRADAVIHTGFGHCVSHFFIHRALNHALALPKARLHGFSLIEAAIVLAVVGLVIGGIWVAAAKVSEQNRINIVYNDVVGAINKLDQYATWQIGSIYSPMSQTGQKLTALGVFDSTYTYSSFANFKSNKHTYTFNMTSSPGASYFRAIINAPSRAECLGLLNKMMAYVLTRPQTNDYYANGVMTNFSWSSLYFCPAKASGQACFDSGSTQSTLEQMLSDGCVDKTVVISIGR